MSEPAAWERQKRETARQYAAFVAYRDALPSQRAAQRAGWDDVAAARSWRERADAWGNHLAATLVERMLDHEDVTIQLGRIGAQLQAQAAVKLVNQITNGTHDESTLSEAVKLGRSLRAMARDLADDLAPEAYPEREGRGVALREMPQELADDLAPEAYPELGG